MSRHKSAPAYGFAISSLGWCGYRLHWTVDRYYEGSRLRHPRPCHRDTDKAGAVKFALRHSCYKMPDEIREAVVAAIGVKLGKTS